MFKQMTLVSKARLLLGCGVFSLLSLVGVSAHAIPVGLTGDTVNIRLLSPLDGADVSDNALVGSGVEISANVSGTNLSGSGWMLPGSGVAPDGESVNVDAFTIVMRILMGDPNNNTTGLAAGAKWIFSSLDLALTDNLEIYGVSAAATGGTISNFDSSWASFDSPTEVSFALDQIVFNPATGGTTFGQVTLTLLTRTPQGGGGGTAPEPGSLVLAGLAMVGLWASRRRVRLG